MSADANARHEEHHVVPLWIYWVVFASLMVLTWVTVQAAHYDLGHPVVLTVRVPMNVIVRSTSITASRSV